MTLVHRGYHGSATVFDGKWMISVDGVRDIVVTTCARNADVSAAFEALVDDYLTTCAQVGKEPDKPAEAA